MYPPLQNVSHNTMIPNGWLNVDQTTHLADPVLKRLDQNVIKVYVANGRCR